MKVRPLLSPKNLYYAQNNHPMNSKFRLSKWKTYFSQFIDKFFKIEEVEYLIDYVKFNMGPTLFYVKFLFSHYFLMLVLGCTLLAQIYTGIENWDFEYCSRLDFPIFLN